LHSKCYNAEIIQTGGGEKTFLTPAYGIPVPLSNVGKRTRGENRKGILV
jgi:hypothetical protein